MLTFCVFFFQIARKPLQPLMLEPLQILPAPARNTSLQLPFLGLPLCLLFNIQSFFAFPPIAEHHSRRGAKRKKRGGRVENMKEVAKRQKRTRKNEKMTCCYIFLRRNEIFLSSKVHECVFHAYGFIDAHRAPKSYFHTPPTHSVSSLTHQSPRTRVSAVCHRSKRQNTKHDRDILITAVRLTKHQTTKSLSLKGGVPRISD